METTKRRTQPVLAALGLAFVGLMAVLASAQLLKFLQAIGLNAETAAQITLWYGILLGTVTVSVVGVIGLRVFRASVCQTRIAEQAWIEKNGEIPNGMCLAVRNQPNGGKIAVLERVA